MAGTDGTPITNATATETPSQEEFCERTGFRVPRGKLVREWTGEWVRPQSYEKRHPLDLLREIPREKSSALRNPEPDDAFVEDLFPAGVGPSDL
jgi:hypothetical protein